MPTDINSPNLKYYELFYHFQGRSEMMENIWAEAFGEEYPENLDHYGYLTKTDIEYISATLQLSPGEKLLDVGCGKGGPGMKIAEKMELDLTGVDIVKDAVLQARELQASFDLAYSPNFMVGELYNIPVEDDCFDAVICVDSLWTVDDKVKALSEVKRVLKTDGRFIFTHWDTIGFDPETIFEHSGLTFVSRQDTPNWKKYQDAVYRGIIRNQRALISEMGDSASALIYEATSSHIHLNKSIRRIYEFQLLN